ncbi:PIG-L family deacetylase [Candidatus Saccharibacteria bacterium]|nr:MAG: PIG-L family deacetylase [Candidatus Saccharibacteria bacterium]
MATSPETLRHPFAEPGTRALVALAHPDDEYLIGSGIDAQVRNGVIVHAFVATKGKASMRGDSLNQISISRGSRALEGRAALSAYGISPRRQHIYDFPDGQLLDTTPDVLAQEIRSLLAKNDITTVITLGEHGFDGHTDHVAVHEAARAAVAAHAEIQPGMRLFGLDLASPTTHIVADPGAKLRRLRHHRSQFDIDTTDPSYEPLGGTVEQPGIQLSPDTRNRLAKYVLLQEQEPYRLETFSSVYLQPSVPDLRELARV